jgi:hypothetical protein
MRGIAVAQLLRKAADRIEEGVGMQAEARLDAAAVVS